LGLKVCRNLKGAWENVKTQVIDGSWRIRILECLGTTKDVGPSEGLRIHPTSDRNLGVGETVRRSYVLPSFVSLVRILFILEKGEMFRQRL
jgi:hypothetical protein